MKIAFVLYSLLMVGLIIGALVEQSTENEKFSSLYAARLLCKNRITLNISDRREARFAQQYCVDTLKASFPKIIDEEVLR